MVALRRVPLISVIIKQPAASEPVFHIYEIFSSARTQLRPGVVLTAAPRGEEGLRQVREGG